ncbi:hypothetical protein T4C_5210 [Trichinella pseudospiralis]|uniref:Uncharacterized protein n=1 Tax=Trichinella pseudospiralis TaxID=6337 RepID=A0A0V1GNY3_TRIPS|nr:hypothetical protein T4C_5210 [Trichinella pseudospiralis]
MRRKGISGNIEMQFVAYCGLQLDIAKQEQRL